MADISIVSAAYEHKATNAGIAEAVMRRLIPAFYARVRRDPMLGPVFDTIIDDRWPAHIETVISFWLYVTRLDRSYNARNFIPAHIKHAAIRADLIPQWLALFRDTAEDFCSADCAAVLVDIAQRMASSLQISLEKREATPSSHRHRLHH